LWVSGTKPTAPVVTAVDGAVDSPDRIAWSPNGSYAAVYSGRVRRAQVIRDASRAPAAGPGIDLDLNLTALAISDNGDLLVGAESGVWLAASGAAPRLVADAVRPSALALNGDTLFIADQGSDRIVKVQNFASSPVAETFLDGVPTPVGVQVSSNGKRVLVASGDGKFVAAYDLSTRTPAGKADLDFSPTELRGIGGRDVWVLNS